MNFAKEMLQSKNVGLKSMLRGDMLGTDYEIFKARVTPEKALKILTHFNVKNRDIRKSQLNKLLIQIRNGQWNPNNGDFISITKSGKLSNGQHRLMAIVKSDITIDVHFVLNVSDTAIETVDTNAVRTAKDLLKMEDFKFTSEIPAYIKLKRGVANGHNRLHPNDNIPNVGILRYTQENTEYIYAIVKRATRLYKKNNTISHSEYSVFYDLFSNIDKEACEEFFDYFNNNTSLLNNQHPIFRLSKVLHENKYNNKGKKYSIADRRAMVIIAWNKFYQGKDKVKSIKWDARDSYPTIFGLDYTKYEDILFPKEDNFPS